MSLGPVCFYEHEFYALSNFSSFQILWNDVWWPTSEHVYHSEKFTDPKIKNQILDCKSAHDAFKLSRELKHLRVSDWDEIKTKVMKNILIAKVNQHEYVRRKLIETGERALVEDSWRDDFWGWGPTGKGANWLGRIWEEIRSEIQCTITTP